MKNAGKKLSVLLIFLMLVYCVCAAKEKCREDALEQRMLEEDKRMPEEKSIKIHVVDELPPTVMRTKTSLYDAYPEERFLWTEDGMLFSEKVETIHVNNVWFSVPDMGSLCFGVPVFLTELPADGEQEKKKEWHVVIGKDCEAFDAGMEETKHLIKNGYLQNVLEDYLGNFPEIFPEEREYILQLVAADRDGREEDQTSWWEMYYHLRTTAENGESLLLAVMDISKMIQINGSPASEYDHAGYRIFPQEGNIWKLIEEPEADRGKVWVNQWNGEIFQEEEEIKAYIEERGARLLLPEGVDTEVDWQCVKEEGFWYDYLVWRGETRDYELTLAVPLMEKSGGSWYLASLIRREAVDKESCRHVLSGIMQTFHGVPYVHTVKEGETLYTIAEKYRSSENDCRLFLQYDGEENRPFENPDIIRSGQQVIVPLREGRNK